MVMRITLIFAIFVLGWKETVGASGAEDDNPQGSGTLVFVFDVTGSMSEDLVHARNLAEQIFDTTVAGNAVSNYLLVPFNDPAIGPITITTDKDVFHRALMDLTVNGGGDCPEMSIGGIKTALENCNPNSFIYVFTDASAKDYHLKNIVLSLVQPQNTQIVFVMTGDCAGVSEPGYTVYHEISSTSSGQVFRLDKSEVHQILEFVRDAVQSQKVNLVSLDVQTASTTILDLPVDIYLQEFTVSVSGVNPEINITDMNGTELLLGIRYKILLDIDQVLVANVYDLQPGMWKVRISVDGPHTIRITGISCLDFVYGFSLSPTLNFDETEPGPIAGVASFLLINTTHCNPSGKLTNFQLIDLYGNVLLSLSLDYDPSHHTLYLTSQFTVPAIHFFIRVSVIDSEGNSFARITRTTIMPASEEECKVWAMGFGTKASCEVDVNCEENSMTVLFRSTDFPMLTQSTAFCDSNVSRVYFERKNASIWMTDPIANSEASSNSSNSDGFPIFWITCYILYGGESFSFKKDQQFIAQCTLTNETMISMESYLTITDEDTDFGEVDGFYSSNSTGYMFICPKVDASSGCLSQHTNVSLGEEICIRMWYEEEIGDIQIVQMSFSTQTGSSSIYVYEDCIRNSNSFIGSVLDPEPPYTRYCSSHEIENCPRNRMQCFTVFAFTNEDTMKIEVVLKRTQALNVKDSCASGHRSRRNIKLNDSEDDEEEVDIVMSYILKINGVQKMDKYDSDYKEEMKSPLTKAAFVCILVASGLFIMVMSLLIYILKYKTVKIAALGSSKAFSKN